MFSGIVAAIGQIVEVVEREQGVRIRVACPALQPQSSSLGDSIAVRGVCLTIVECDQQGFAADVSAETLACTEGLGTPGPVNLEKALRFGDQIGGHLVSGHVDGVGRVLSMQGSGDDRIVRFAAPADLARYIARKGSIAVEGVSLTINQVDGAQFTVNLIPHTLSVTTLGTLTAGTRVNLEIDQIARYVDRLIAPEIPRST